MKSTLKALIVAGFMLAVTGVAFAAPPHHGKPKHGGFHPPKHGGFHPPKHHPGGHHHFKPFVPSRRIIRRYPRGPRYVSPRVIYPLRLTSPALTIIRRTVVTAPEPDPADEIRARLDELKTEYYKLSKTRQDLLSWLAGPGQSASAIDRMKVETRVAMIERDCTRLAGEMAELELRLAQL